MTASNSAGESDKSSRKYITTGAAPVVFSVTHDQLSGTELTMDPEANENDFCTLKVKSNTAWTATLTNNSSGFINLVATDTNSATIKSITKASGAANTTLNLRLKIKTVPAAGKTSTATLKFSVGTQSYTYTIKLTKPAMPIPDAPVQKALTASGNSMTVSWSKSTGATSYTVYYGTSASVSSAKSINVGNTTSKTITGLDYDTKYYTWVTASNSAGESDKSNRRNITTDIKSLIDIKGVQLDTTSETLVIGETYTLTASPKPSNATVTTTTTWSSSNTAVAKVNSSTGKIKAVAEGTASITATMTSETGTQKTATCLVTVIPEEGTFIVKKGSTTIIPNGGTSGSFACGAAAGENDVATFKITSDYTWTVKASDTSWMRVDKTNSTTAVVTIGKVQDGKSYSSTLTFTANGKNYTVKVTLDKPGGNTPVITGNFTKKTKTLTLGQNWIVEGTVSINSGSLGVITVNSGDGGGFTLTDNFASHGYNSVSLEYWAAYKIDTTKAPFNTPGTFTLKLWAKDVNGVGGDKVLDTMTLIITESSGYAQPISVPGARWGTYNLSGNGGKHHDVVNVKLDVPVYAIADGTIQCYQVVSTTSGAYHEGKLISYGNVIEFTSTDGKTTARYAHLNRFRFCTGDVPSSYSEQVSAETAGVKREWRPVGTTYKVSKGEIIGYVGTTGNSTGPHLHFELRINGVRVEPSDYVNIN